MSTPQELLERVEAASGPDRFLNRQIHHALTGEDASEGAPSYTASIDAAVGLVERMLPGLWWKVARGCKCDAGHRYYGFVFGELDWGKPTQRSIGYWEGTRDLIECSGATPALALCAALLKAMIASKP